uniref:Uncharacterized protein n=1 Tax=Arundo donax TaxID=35708 RepID=A0A0A9EN59_ARUDO
MALAIVQSYNQRRKVPRSEISIPDLELCLSKAAFSAAQCSANIHMPRIGYQGGSQRSEWYTIERLLRKYSSLHGINMQIFLFDMRSDGVPDGGAVSILVIVELGPQHHTSILGGVLQRRKQLRVEAPHWRSSGWPCSPVCIGKVGCCRIEPTHSLCLKGFSNPLIWERTLGRC